MVPGGAITRAVLVELLPPLCLRIVCCQQSCSSHQTPFKRILCSFSISITCVFCSPGWLQMQQNGHEAIKVLSFPRGIHFKLPRDIRQLVKSIQPCPRLCHRPGHSPPSPSCPPFAENGVSVWFVFHSSSCHTIVALASIGPSRESNHNLVFNTTRVPNKWSRVALLPGQC